jgi:SRSO17 transposase
MQLPIVAPAPIVTTHADIFRDLFENRCQFRHFQNYLTGLIVLDNKSLAHSTRCVLESADNTNLARFFSEALWFQDRVNDRRVEYLLQQTKGDHEFPSLFLALGSPIVFQYSRALTFFADYL